MLNKLKSIWHIVWHYRLLKFACSINRSGYLQEIGWIKSFEHKEPIDENGNPLPWVTYGFMDFIESRLNKKMVIFEYGSGNSTLWYAQKVQKVVSVEHDRKWYHKIEQKMPENVELFYRKLEYNGEYSQASKTIKDKKYDMIIIDGRDRAMCAKNALENLKGNGVLILDDSEREIYKEVFNMMKKYGYKNIDFWGISPGLFYKKCTTIFYKYNNCLDI